MDIANLKLHCLMILRIYRYVWNEEVIKCRGYNCINAYNPTLFDAAMPSEQTIGCFQQHNTDARWWWASSTNAVWVNS